jgi:transposase
MRALDPEVVDAVWAAVEGLIPPRVENHPLGCHRRRIPDRVCFEAILIRLAIGCSWEDAERLSRTPVSDTTLRDRRDEWVAAGVFDALVDQALNAYDRVVGLDLSDSAVDGSTHKAPCGGDGTGPSPTDRGKLGWKWSALTDRHGIPVGWATEGANRHDVILFEPTLQAAARRGLLADVETLHLDRGYDIPRIVDECARHGLGDVVCGKRRAYGQGGPPKRLPLGMRWPIERTNSWLTNFGQLRRNTDRKHHHRLAQIALAVTILIASKLIDWRNRWSPNTRPIR